MSDDFNKEETLKELIDQIEENIRKELIEQGVPAEKLDKTKVEFSAEAMAELETIANEMAEEEEREALGLEFDEEDGEVE